MNQFDTQLSPELEKTYREWMQHIAHTKEKGMAVDDNYTGTNYDYRGWFKKYGPLAKSKGEHFNDEFKKPNHPSFSDGSQYSKPGTPLQGGVWQGQQYNVGESKSFVPSTLNSLAEFIRTQRIPWVSK